MLDSINEFRTGTEAWYQNKEVTIFSDEEWSIKDAVYAEISEGVVLGKSAGITELTASFPSLEKVITVPLVVYSEHNFQNYQEIKKATCTEDGLKKAVCDICGKEDIKSISKLGPDFAQAYTIDKQASCTEPGSKSQHCSRCGEKQNVTEIPMVDHTYGEWQIDDIQPGDTQITKHHTCTECGKTQTVTESISDPAMEKVGDLDGDGKIDSADALTVLKIAAKLITPTAEQEETADVDQNGTIDSADALLILKYAAKLITEL